MLKAVVDTNQFVSAFISRHGPSAQLLDAWRGQKFMLITAEEIIWEIHRVLRYPKITRACRLEEGEIDALVDLLEDEAVVMRHLPKLDVIKEDPDGKAHIVGKVVQKAHEEDTNRMFLDLLRKNPELKSALVEAPTDSAMAAHLKGGIDFNADKVDSAFAVKNSDGEISAKGGYASGVKFNLDPAMLEQLQNAPGFVPVIINVSPLKDLPAFLGLNDPTPQSAVAAL